MKAVTFILAENSVATLFFSLRLYPGKVTRHMTSDIEVCEIDLDTQMNLLSAAQCRFTLDPFQSI